MNQESEALIKRLLTELDASAGGELTLPLRKRLWATITAGKPGPDRRIILTTLDSLCVVHGQSFWLRKMGDANGLTRLLKVAEDVARGLITAEDGLKVRDAFYVDVVEDQEYEPGEYPTMFLGHAAANTVVTAAGTFTFDPRDLREDRDLDPEAYEPSFLVACAFAGGLAEEGDAGRRRQFWQWYLNEAVHQVV